MVSAAPRDTPPPAPGTPLPGRGQSTRLSHAASCGAHPAGTARKPGGKTRASPSSRWAENIFHFLAIKSVAWVIPREQSVLAGLDRAHLPGEGRHRALEEQPGSRQTQPWLQLGGLEALAPTQPRTGGWRRAPLPYGLQNPGQLASPNCKEMSYPGRKPGFPLPWITAPLLSSPPPSIHADARQLVGAQQHPGLVPASPGWKGWHEAGSTPCPLLKPHSKPPDAHAALGFSFHPSWFSTSLACLSSRSGATAQLTSSPAEPGDNP